MNNYRKVWEKDPSRNNEALDCRVYARAAASIYGLDRMSEYRWKKLEETSGIEITVPEVRAEVKPKSKTVVPKRKSMKAKDPYL